MKTRIAGAMLVATMFGVTRAAAADSVCDGAPSRQDAKTKTKLLGELIGLNERANLRTMRTLDDQRSVTAAFRETANLLKCDEPALSGKELADVQAWEVKAVKWADERDKVLDAEEKTRNEVARPLCGAIWGAEYEEQIIAHERSNPSGVVNLRVLHEAGEALSDYRAQIAALRPAYAKARGHQLANWRDEGACLVDYDKAQEGQ